MGQVYRIGLLLACIILVHCGTADARSRNKNVSSNGAFSFQLESNGYILPTHQHRGKSYIEGTWGEDYHIRVFNHTGQRIEAVVTVDGRDVITGQSGNYRKNRGYVIEPYGSVLIDGFRTSWQRVAAFRFTDKNDSYAARMGGGRNVGVIGVAIFQENRPPQPKPIIRYQERPNRRGRSYESPSAPQLEMDDRAGSSVKSKKSRARRQSLGTQYGRDTYSPSTNTQFNRRSKWRPDALLAVHYDDYDGLASKGVLPRPTPHYSSPHPDPFPGSPRNNFAPPPPRYYWE